MARNIIHFLKKYYFLNIIVNVNFFSDLNITASTTLKYCKNYWVMKYLGLWSPGLRKFFWKIYKTLPCFPSYMFNVFSLKTFFFLGQFKVFLSTMFTVDPLDLILLDISKKFVIFNQIFTWNLIPETFIFLWNFLVWRILSCFYLYFGINCKVLL